MLLHQSSLESIHRFCHSNTELLPRSTSAGCFCCGATFAPADIKDWVHEELPGMPPGDTAKCPKCGVDSVLPSAAPIMLSPRMLAAMQSYWFSSKPQRTSDS